MFRAIVNILLLCAYVRFSEGNSCNVNLNGVKISWDGIHTTNTSETKNGLDSLIDPTRIRINNQSIPALCENTIKNFDLLFDLSLNYNGIEKISPGAFVNVGRLFSLSLQGNDLEEIQHGVFNSLSVGVLKLQNNKIEIIEPTAFDDMPKLKILDLSHNKIRSVNPKWFKNTPSIVLLSFEHNEISVLAAGSFKMLKRPSDVEQVKMLDLSNNKISFVHPKAFDGLRELGSLYLNGNMIKTLNENVFSTLHRISLLALHENAIECLPHDLDNLFKADEVFIEENPWNCDCLDEVKAWVKRNGRSVSLSLSSAKCMMSKLFGTLEKAS